MKTILKSSLILTLVSVMMLSTLSVATSAAEYDEYTRTIYFINNKEWDSVSAYTWSDENGEEVAFPGVKIEKVGTTDMRSDILTDTYDVYAINVDKNDDYVIFNEGFEHGQQSTTVDLRYPWGGVNIIYLDKDNNAIVGHFFDLSRITPLSE